MWFALGFIYGSFLEWGVHKHLFHRHGKKKGSPFAFHIREHHLECLKNENRHDDFSLRENVGVLLIIALHLPIVYLSTGLFVGMTLYGLAFITLHKLIHKNVAWGKKWFPWHWDHHMKHQNHNFNVVLPIADHVMRTRKKYLTSLL